MSKVTCEPSLAGRTRPSTWGRKSEEYIADFQLITKRTLTEEELRICKYHFYLGADWKLCCRKLNLDRGSFFHAVYRIEQKLGLVFRDLQPYPLFPLEEYFNGPSLWPKSASEVWRQAAAPAPPEPIKRLVKRRVFRETPRIAKAA